MTDVYLLLLLLELLLLLLLWHQAEHWGLTGCNLHEIGAAEESTKRADIHKHSNQTESLAAITAEPPPEAGSAMFIPSGFMAGFMYDMPGYIP